MTGRRIAARVLPRFYRPGRARYARRSLTVVAAVATAGLLLAAAGVILTLTMRQGDVASTLSDAEIDALLNTRLGGDTTVVSSNRNSFGLAAPNLSRLERRTFEVGDSFFSRNWITAPASTDARDGLGPASTRSPAHPATPWMGAASPRKTMPTGSAACCSAFPSPALMPIPEAHCRSLTTAASCKTAPS